MHPFRSSWPGTPDLFRLGALAVLAGGLAGAYAHHVHPHAPTTAGAVPGFVAASAPVHLILFCAGLAAIVGLPAVYVAQHQRAGTVGLAGFVLLVVGLVFGDLIHCPIEFGLLPALVQIGELDGALEGMRAANAGGTLNALHFWGGILFLVGSILFAVATLRAGALPRWTAAALLLSSAAMVGTMFGLGDQIPLNFATIFYLALAGYGVAVLRAPHPGAPAAASAASAAELNVSARPFAEGSKTRPARHTVQ